MSVSRDLPESSVTSFADSMEVAIESIAGDEPQWDIDVRSYETHERVAYYVSLFSTTARDRFAARLSLGTRYEAMIRSKLRTSGMPEDLTYLALIESGYDTDAYSRAAAVGIWQFMAATARGIGLRVDWWVDERRDPARATDGAIRFLDDLQKQFGSYYLAAAAYNGGPGRVSRGLTQYASQLEGFEGDDRFFALAEGDYLAAETRNYVPQLIAAALVAKTPDRYGIVIDTLPVYRYDSVLVAPGTSLAAVSRAGGGSADEIRDLNRALLRGMAPPDSPVWVRVIPGSAGWTTSALDTMTSVDGVTSLEISAATNAATFARKHGLTLKQLRWYNPALRVTSKGRLATGQTVRVPDTATVAFARDVPDPSIERYGSTQVKVQSGAVHVVRRGETLGGIAQRYGLTVARLQAMNGLRGTRINAGQKLQVRTSGRSTSAARSTAGAKGASRMTKTSPGKGSVSEKAAPASAKSAVSSADANRQPLF